MKKITGFTLIELMVTLAVAAILLTVGLPSFLNTIQNNRATSNANSFIGYLAAARAEAVKQGRPVTLCASSNQSECQNPGTATWNDGWIMFVDLNSNGLRDAGAGDGDVLKSSNGFSAELNMQGGVFGNRITYLPSGRAINSAGAGATAGTFILSQGVDTNDDGIFNAADTKYSRTIIINNVGRASSGGVDPETNVALDAQGDPITAIW